MYRYIYGFEIDFKLFDLYESFVAADRYKLHGFSKALTDYIKAKLNAENSCLIYDQLIKIGEREEILLADVRTIIIENSQKAFASEHFTQIDQETLISLLSPNKLNIAEIDLLKAVSRWVDCKVQRQGLPMNDMNRQLAFEPIKRYISFTAFTPDQITACEAIKHLFPRKVIESFTQQARQVDAAPLTPQATSSKSLTAFEATTSDHQEFNLEPYEHLNVSSYCYTLCVYFFVCLLFWYLLLIHFMYNRSINRSVAISQLWPRRTGARRNRSATVTRRSDHAVAMTIPV